jgi:hypothetical protein
LVVLSAVPLFPTATQNVVLGQLTAKRSSVVPETCALQVAPELVEWYIKPASPTAQHDDEKQLTPAKNFVLRGVDPSCQLVPFVVYATKPASPTAAQAVVLLQLMELMYETGVCGIQDEPPLMVFCIGQP